MNSQITMNALQQQMLKNYIENVFEKYDTDKNGVLDAQEMMAFFNDLYKNMGTENTINIEQAKAAIQSIDTNNDGNVDRAELFAAFKQLMAANQPMQNIVQYQQQQQVYQQPQMQPMMPQQPQMVYQSYPQQYPQQYAQYPQQYPQQQPVYYAPQQPTNPTHSAWAARPQQPQYQVINMPKKQNSNRQVYTQQNGNGCNIY